MSSLLASVIWTLPTAVRVNSSSMRSMHLFSGGFGQKKADSGVANPLQVIYDSLVSITDVDESMRLSKECPSIRACLEAMNTVKLSDLGLDEAYVLNAKDSVCMNIVNSAEFDIQVFVIPKGKQLPLHDHPNMAVLSKVISGTLNVRSFSPTKPGIGGDSSAGSASLILSATRTPTDSSWMLTPSEGNVHELKAEGTTIVLDVLMPPYLIPDRPCHFYRSVESEGNWALESVPDPPNRSLPNTVPFRGQKPVLREVKWGSMFRRSSPARK